MTSPSPPVNPRARANISQGFGAVPDQPPEVPRPRHPDKRIWPYCTNIPITGHRGETDKPLPKRPKPKPGAYRSELSRPQSNHRDCVNAKRTVRTLRCKTVRFIVRVSAYPWFCLGSSMSHRDDHLSLGITIPKASSYRGCVLPGLAPLLGLAPWRRLPVPLPCRQGTCVSLARYRYSPLREKAFPIVSSRCQSLRPAPTFYRLRVLLRLLSASDFTNSGAGKFLTAPSRYRRPKSPG